MDHLHFFAGVSLVFFRTDLRNQIEPNWILENSGLMIVTAVIGWGVLLVPLPSPSEMFVIIVVAILLFGARLADRMPGTFGPS